MRGIFLKIKNRFSFLVNDLKIDLKYFSLELALVKFINGISYKGSFLKKINKWSQNKKNHYILKYLSKNYGYIIEKYKNEKETALYSEKKYIWICWLQGEELAPKLVKNCIDSIRRHANNHEVVLINMENYKNYIKIPKYILDKYQKGIISNAHFSDIIRMTLLRDYGGLWIDATVFFTKDIPNNVFDKVFFSCKSPKVETNYISGLQWTSFIIGGKKNSLFYRYILDFYLDYWRNEDIIIDYLLIDYIIYLGYHKINNIKIAIDKNPINNLKRDELAAIFNQEFDLEKYKKIIESDTYFFKLSWREKFKEKTDEGRDTFYTVFLNKYNELICKY